MRLWHFTSLVHVNWIVEAGFLKTTDSNLYMDNRPSPSCCWFLDVPDTGEASHGLEGSVVDKKQVRFEVDVPDSWARQWLPWAEAQGIDREWRDIMLRVGGGQEAAEHWWVTFRKVPIDKWVRVDILLDGNWEEFAPSPTAKAVELMSQR